MTTVRKIELESIFLISLIAIGSLYFVIQRNNQGQSVKIASPMNVEEVSPETVSSQISPDGKKQVIMRITQNQDNTQTFSFYTKDSLSIDEKLIFSKALDLTKNMKVPYNAWSPDDQYFFIEENSALEKNIYAFKGNGGSFSESEPYFNVSELFKSKITDYSLEEATGWASESLIIINTKKLDGAKGPSYWFEIPSKAVIQLSTEF